MQLYYNIHKTNWRSTTKEIRIYKIQFTREMLFLHIHYSGYFYLQSNNFNYLRNKGLISYITYGIFSYYFHYLHYLDLHIDTNGRRIEGEELIFPKD